MNVWKHCLYAHWFPKANTKLLIRRLKKRKKEMANIAHLKNDYCFEVSAIWIDLILTVEHQDHVLCLEPIGRKNNKVTGGALMPSRKCLWGCLSLPVWVLSRATNDQIHTAVFADVLIKRTGCSGLNVLPCLDRASVILPNSHWSLFPVGSIPVKTKKQEFSTQSVCVPFCVAFTHCHPSCVKTEVC